MATEHPRCTKCGWWDMAMRYGNMSRCTRCGSPVLSLLEEERRLAEPARHSPKQMKRHHVA